MNLSCICSLIKGGREDSSQELSACLVASLATSSVAGSKSIEMLPVVPTAEIEL